MRPNARATDSPRGLTHARRADQRHDSARAAAADHFQSAFRAAGTNRQVLHDPILDVLKAMVVGVQDFACGVDVGRVGGLGVPGQLEDSVQPGTDPARLRTLVAGSLELANLTECGLAHVIWQVGRLNTGSIVLSAVRLVLTQFLADRIQLLTQQELPLALLHALANVVGDLLVDLGLGDVGLGPLDQRRQPFDDIGGLQQLALPLVTQPRRVPSQVGQG